MFREEQALLQTVMILVYKKEIYKITKLDYVIIH